MAEKVDREPERPGTSRDNPSKRTFCSADPVFLPPPPSPKFPAQSGPHANRHFPSLEKTLLVAPPPPTSVVHKGPYRVGGKVQAPRLIRQRAAGGRGHARDLALYAWPRLPADGKIQRCQNFMTAE